jgi:hypothetical protein
MVKLNEIQKSILKWLSTNHKATREIRKHLFDDFGRSVSEEAFYTALLGLHSAGFVTSYIYDNQSEKYALISSPDEYSIDALNWLAIQEAE